MERVYDYSQLRFTRCIMSLLSVIFVDTLKPPDYMILAFRDSAAGSWSKDGMLYYC